MYYPTEAVGDYALEEGVTDFEPLQEDVLVLQDRDYEQMSLDETVQVLETAFNDLERLQRLQTTTKKAHETSGGNLRQTLAASVLVREGLSDLRKRYGSTGLVTESALYTGSNLVVVLEEEEKQTKGLFVRIWEQIAAAFKWVWTKLTGLFSSGEEKAEKKAEEAQKASEKVSDVIEQAAQNGTHPGFNEEMLSSYLAVLGRHYAFLGEPTIEKIEAHLKVLEKNSVTLKDMVEKLTTIYQSWLELTKSITPDLTEEAYRTKFEGLIKLIEGLSTGMTASSLEEMKKHRVDIRHQEANVVAVHKLSGFGRNQQFFAFGLKVSMGPLFAEPPVLTETVFSPPDIPSNSTKPVPVPKPELIKPLTHEAQRVLVKHSSHSATFGSLMEKNAKRTVEIEDLDKRIPDGLSNDQQKLYQARVMALGAVARRVVHYLTDLGKAEHSIQVSLNVVFDFIHGSERAIVKDVTKTDDK